MKWIDHQIGTNADLKRKVKEYFNEMIIKERLTALRAGRGLLAVENVHRNNPVERKGGGSPH